MLPLKDQSQRPRRPRHFKSNSLQQSSTSSPSTLASLLLQGPFQRIVKRKNSLLSLFPRSNTTPADYSCSTLRCFAKLQVPPSPLSGRPSLQTQLVELHCPSIQQHRNREPLQHPNHTLYSHSAPCSSTDITDDGQGGYGGGDLTPHDHHNPRIAILPSSSTGATKTANMALATSSSTPTLVPAMDPASKLGSMTATISTASRMSSASGSHGSHEAGAVSRTSLGDLSAYGSSYPGESSNVILGPNGILTPRSSILRNPSNKKTFVDAWRPKDGSGPAVLQIQARQTVRDREAEKERERLAREKEIERELKEMEQAEKVWGIPKKAFYMGLGDINFNAQMAILGGWGNGSGPATDFRPNVPSLATRRVSTGKIKTKREREREKEKRQAIQRAEERRKEKEKEKVDEGDSEDSIDAEELAALNAIINTRRSMEAAQALASRNNRIVAVRKSQENLQEVASHTRPALDVPQQASNDSVQTAVRSTGEGVLAVSSRSSSRARPRLARTASSDVQQRQSRIRFAPLPQAYNSIPIPSPSPGIELMQEPPMEGMLQDSGVMPRESPGAATSDEGSDTSDLDEPEECDDGRGRRLSSLSGSKSRWYLMGMPKSVFRPHNYRSLRRPTSSMGVESALAGELGTSPGIDRSASERRGRRTSRMRRSASLAGSIKSRSSSVNSNDEEERMRRRQLIRASRPGGTGMVTLPDGTRIRARRVGEEESEEEEFNEWGFAGLSRRRSMEDPETPLGQVKSGEKRASDDEAGQDEVDEGSGMAWVKRRRRAREESRQRDAKEATSTEKVRLPEAAQQADLPMPVKKASDGTDQGSVHSKQPSLNALQAAEVRRRHEEEVAALGAEVLESIAKHKKGKQQPSRSATWDPSQQVPPTEKPSTATQTNAANVAEQRPVPKPRGRPRRAVSMFNSEEGEEQSHRPSTLANVRSADATRSSSQPTNNLDMGPGTMPSSPTFNDAGSSATGFETPAKGLTRVSSQMSSRVPSTVVDVSRQSLPASPGLASLSHADDNPTSAPVEMRSMSPDSMASLRGSKSSVGSPPRQDLSSMSQASPAVRRRRYSGSSLVSAPLPNLPRKPDSKGYAVVPLPIHQLGRRPERPREGRVWLFDDDDDDSDGDATRRSDDDERDTDDEESDGDEADRKKDDDDDDDDDDENTMNDEEIAEEERKTAIEKKRATTRAAGAELVSSLAKPNASKKAAARSPTIKKEKEIAPSHREVSPARKQPLSISPAQRSGAKNRSPTDAGEESDISDDLDLWPPTLSGTQLSRTLSAGEMTVSTEASTGRRGSSASNRNVREAVSLAAHSAKARVVRDRKSKEAKEKEKLRALKRKEERDLDYGWPKSLHGSSLYD